MAGLKRLYAQVDYSRFADDPLGTAAGIRTSDTTQATGANGPKGTITKPPSGHAEHHECHIIVLGSTRGERLCGGQDSPHAFQSRKPMTCFGEFDQSLFAPFFVASVHGFGYSVRKEHYQVSRLMRKHTSLILLWEKPDHRTTDFQA